MPNSLQDLYAQPAFRTKVQGGLEAKARTLGISPTDLANFELSDENEDRLQGEINFSAKVSAGVAGSGLNGELDFAVPWDWVDMEIAEVADMARVEVIDLWQAGT